jgi:hypothetical protein
MHGGGTIAWGSPSSLVVVRIEPVVIMQEECKAECP